MTSFPNSGNHLITEEVNRLTRQGINILTVMSILDGEVAEADALYDIAYAAREHCWSLVQSNLNQSYPPSWYTGHYHFKYTWDSHRDAKPYPNLEVIHNVDLYRLDSLIFPTTKRLTEPFSHEYRDKSISLAYRWSLGLGVSPPYIMPWHGKLAIGQGFHRYYLAKHYMLMTIPILVERTSASEIRALLFDDD
ncbi:hypothetical protein C9975_03455 [Thalassospira xiamenensis]|nr:hypothetical protein C9975_03455 [Thalassospira xiamenensis]